MRLMKVDRQKLFTKEFLKMKTPGMRQDSKKLYD